MVFWNLVWQTCYVKCAYYDLLAAIPKCHEFYMYKCTLYLIHLRRGAKLNGLYGHIHVKTQQVHIMFTVHIRIMFNSIHFVLRLFHSRSFLFNTKHCPNVRKRSATSGWKYFHFFHIRMVNTS